MTRRELAQVLADAVEQVAREEAERRGFDIATESHGLLRSMMAVLTNKELFAEAQRRAREKANAQ
jgi:predicted transcriptional regulator